MIVTLLPSLRGLAGPAPGRSAGCPAPARVRARLLLPGPRGPARLPGQAPAAAPARGQPRRGRRGAITTRAVFESFTERAIKAVMLSQHEAKALGCLEAGAVHILLGLLSLDAAGAAIYLGPGASLEQGRAALQNLTGRRRRDVSNAQDVAFTADAKRVFEAAQRDAKRQQQKFISPEHILIAVLSSGDAVLKQVLNGMRVDINASRAAVQRKLDADKEVEGGKQKVGAGNVEGGGGGAAKAGEEKMLEAFCRDLCEAARQGQLDPVIGREKEVARVIQILARRSKNNPVLLGEPGTGKTAIAEGLAAAIVRGADARGGGALPAFLLRKRVLQLDVGGLVSGSRERGELEKRVTGILAECEAAGDVVLMIDEIHCIVGAGAVGRTSGFASGGLDLGNLLKPALARGRLQVIGATTLREHRQHFERDAALERRFQPVLVGEPTAAEAEDILRGLQDKYERFHRCVYSDAAVAAAVTLSERYLPDRFLPDKAIDLLDEAGSRARIAAFAARGGAGGDADAGPHLELQQVLETKAAYIQEGLWEEAALLRARELELKTRLSSECEAAGGGGGPLLPAVGPADIAAIVAAWTGIPAAEVTAEEGRDLVNLPAALKERVVGQDAAVEAIARAVQRARSGLRDPRRPVASFLLCGPTGVGKTQLARALAELHFGSPAALVRLDMSEYMERHSVSRLLGAPPGFVGHGEGGTLTEAVRKQPHCLLLLDELEKAHPDVFNLLLQVLEDGRLTDSQGRTVSFKHALVVATSNVGSAHIAQGGQRLGFALDAGAEADGSHLRALVHEELKAFFRPELLNRLDDVIVFGQLSRSHLQQIADALLQETAARLRAATGAGLQLSRPLMSRLLDAGWDQAYGARPLKRAITQWVEDPLADAILGGRLRPGGVAWLDLAPDGMTVTAEALPVDGGIVLKSEIVSKPAGVRKAAESKALT